MQQQSIQLILVDPNYRVSTAFKERFSYLPNVKIVNSGFEQLTNYDCLVSMEINIDVTIE